MYFVDHPSTVSVDHRTVNQGKPHIRFERMTFALQNRELMQLMGTLVKARRLFALKFWASLLGITYFIGPSPVLADEKPMTRDQPEYQVNVGIVYGTLSELCKLKKIQYITEQQFTERSRTYTRMWLEEQWLTDGLVFLGMKSPECLDQLKGILAAALSSGSEGKA